MAAYFRPQRGPDRHGRLRNFLNSAEIAIFIDGYPCYMNSFHLMCWIDSVDSEVTVTAYDRETDPLFVIRVDERKCYDVEVRILLTNNNQHEWLKVAGCGIHDNVH